ncbi:MAG: SLBB domain-containing protein [Salinivenus sp.]
MMRAVVSALPDAPPAWGALCLLLLAGATATAPAFGQAFGRVEETKSNVAYFYHARPGEATVQISVWGTVPRPGIYEIPDTTDLDKLLTMAGGAPLEAQTEGREDATITVRVYRPEQDGRSQLFEAPLERMLQGNTSYPALRDNDIVVVETVRPKQPFGWRDVLSIASSLGSLTLLALRIFTRV